MAHALVVRRRTRELYLWSSLASRQNEASSTGSVRVFVSVVGGATPTYCKNRGSSKRFVRSIFSAMRKGTRNEKEGFSSGGGRPRKEKRFLFELKLSLSTCCHGRIVLKE